MKKLFIFIVAFAVSGVNAYSQNAQQAAVEATQALLDAQEAQNQPKKPVYWDLGAKFSLGLTQMALVNWAAGGYNSASILANIDLNGNYKKDLVTWNNRLQMDYGALWSQDKAKVLQITSDRLYLESKWGLDMSQKSHWRYTAGIDFKTQFSDNYNSYDNDGGKNLKSAFMSPAYTNIALGLEWFPAQWFTLNVAPLTGGLVICTDTRGDDKGVALRQSYGMAAKDDFFSPVLFQFGAQLKANAKVIINDVFTVESQLVLFTDYLYRPFVQTRINWDNAISWKLNRLISLGFKTWLIYDPIVMIEGEQKVQFKEFLSFNFTLALANKK